MQERETFITMSATMFAHRTSLSANGFSGNGFSGNGFSGNGFGGNGMGLERVFDLSEVNLEELVKA